MLNIELLYIAGCPGKETAEAALKQALREEGVSACFSAVQVELPPDEFSGSPTLLFDGEDPYLDEPAGQQALSCRVYATPQGLANAPTVEMLRQTLRYYRG